MRHLDCGSCNGCELELSALTNPLYDMERFGISFVASPRHADVLIMTGPFTRRLAEAAQLMFEAMSTPRRIVAIGDCADDGGIFKESYAVAPRPDELERAIVARVRGCPPTPDEILEALVKEL
jgi:Ni,Fe-hydrogenase III small subunit